MTILNKDDFEKINDVCQRAMGCGIGYKKLDLFMDINCVYDLIDIDKLMQFDAFNFLHDIYGIIQNLNRRTGKLENNFLPRCSK